jgi:predicted nucleic acid-binding protein
VKTYVLDASAVLRYLYAEAGGDRVLQQLRGCHNGDCKAAISAIHWGEVSYIITRREGADAVDPVLASLSSFKLEVVPVTAERAVRAGHVKTSLRIPYADAFAVELASDSSGHVLVTADFDMKPAAQLVTIEFLPVK